MTSETERAAPTFEEIAETFDLLDDWEARYGYIIELGGALAGLDDAQKTPETKVDGCASNVWLVARTVAGPDGAPRLVFEGDSDAHIVRGLIMVLKSLLNGRSPQEVAQANPAADLAKIGLESQLSAQRSNGFRAMVARLQDLARAVHS